MNNMTWSTCSICITSVMCQLYFGLTQSLDVLLNNVIQGKTFKIVVKIWFVVPAKGLIRWH